MSQSPAEYAATSAVAERGSPPPASLLEAGVQVGDFRIERRLGSGGMGIVYQARQLSLNRPVALKVLGQALSRSADVSRFQREAQAAARLKHPGIAQVYFIGQDRHLCYLAMELIDGVSLRRVLDRLSTTSVGETTFDSVVLEDLADDPQAQALRFDTPTEALEQKSTDAKPSAPEASPENPYLSPRARELRMTGPYIRRACEIIRDAARALAHAHAQGVVHRDIKPDNLLLDRDGAVHLIDFGVARFFEDQSVTYTGQLVGTPLYMSPEQVTGRGAIDARTDVYSLGLVLYELLALSPPIEATNRENLLRTIVTKPLVPISWRNKAVSADLERIVHRATQKDPDQRYATADDLAADLDRLLAGKPVAAPPYHFRLDEREITAARPGRVVLAAFIFFVLSFFFFIAVGSITLFMGVMFAGSSSMNAASATALVTPILVSAIVMAGGLIVGRGVLAGRTWARWGGIVLAGLIMFGSAGAAAMAVVGLITLSRMNFDDYDKQFEKAYEKEMAKHPEAERVPASKLAFQPRNAVYAPLAMYVLPVTAGLLLGGTALWALLSRLTGRWFRFAHDIRLEHRQLKARVAG